MKRLLTTLITLATFVGVADAQFGSLWHKYRHEIIFGVGSTNFLGELGGADKVGTHFIRDFEISYSRPLVYTGYRYKLNKSFSVKASAAFGYLYGDDAKTDEKSRKNRNLSFRSPILEFGANIEYNILNEQLGRKYDLSKNKGWGNTPKLYIFTGVNGFWFNPQAKYKDGEYYNLQPLGTEGQNVVDTREPYNTVSMSVPFGLGMNFLIEKYWGIGFEIGGRYTFTDYIDDVSTTYVDPDIFDDPKAAYFSDRSLNSENVGPYTQRGNPNYNDAYMFLTINVTYKLNTLDKGLPKF